MPSPVWDIDDVVELQVRAVLAERPHTIGDVESGCTANAGLTTKPRTLAPPSATWSAWCRSHRAACGAPTHGQSSTRSSSGWAQPLEANLLVDDPALRYLAAFGPATAKDIQIWSWMTGMREVLERLLLRLRTFRDEVGRAASSTSLTGRCRIPTPPRRSASFPSTTTSSCRMTTAAA